MQSLAKPKPILKSVRCAKRTKNIIDQLIRERWYFSRNFEEQTYEIGDKLIYNKCKWKVIKTRRTLHGYAYQLKFIRRLSETELQSVVSKIKGK